MIILSTFWDVLGAMFIVFFVVLPLIMLWGFALADLFLRRASAVHRVIWLLIIIFLPIIGPIVYILTHPIDDTREQLTWDQPKAPTTE